MGLLRKVFEFFVLGSPIASHHKNGFRAGSMRDIDVEIPIADHIRIDQI